MAITDKAVCPDMTKTPLFYVRNRDLVPAQQFPDIVVTQDSESRKIRFIAPRYFDGADFSEKTIAFRYTNADYGYDETLAEDISFDESIIKFTWLVPKGALVKSGFVNFDVTVSDDTDYEWHSKPYPLQVEIGLDVGTQAIEILPDLYRKWRKEASDNLKEMNQIKDSVTGSTESAANSAASALKSANSAATSAQNAKLSEDNAKKSETNAKESETISVNSKEKTLDYANKVAEAEIRVNAKATDVETNRQFVADAKQEVASDKQACEDAVQQCAGYVGYTKTGFIVKDNGKVQFVYYND